MFTGIIKAVGALASVEERGGDRRLTITAAGFDFAGLRLGDSIAVNGVCLTAVVTGPDRFSADVSRETLALTTLGELAAGSAVNLEPALTLATPLGGHLVSGHVDGVGQLISRQPEARSTRMRFRLPAELQRYVARKGSVCIDGTSLTVNDVDQDTFGVNIVPHTLENTIMGGYVQDTAVNIEVDLIARYLERLMPAQN
jgi:riboflavin synthase